MIEPGTDQCIAPESLRMVPYEEEMRWAWNRFVTQEAVNGHFMHTREFLDYHGKRFTDHSLVFFREQRIAAILAAHREGEVLASHRGLTFGGLVVEQEFGAGDSAEAFAALGRHMLEVRLAVLDYRPVPVWYHRLVFEADLLLGPAVYLPAAVCAMDAENEFNATRRNLLQRARRAGLNVECDAALLPFIMQRVAEVLAARYQSVPVHSTAELEWLLSQFPNAIRCYGMRRAGEESLLAGIILFVTPKVVKLQYLGYAENTGESGAMEALFDHVLCLPEFRGRSFDFGTSAEGHSIDGSLMAYKESLGGLLRLVPRISLETNQLLGVKR